MSCGGGKHSFFEKLWAQLSFNAIWILGAISIYLSSPVVAAIYVILFPFFGVLFCIMHLWICPRCPHIKEHNSCVQLPLVFSKRIIKKNAHRPLRTFEKIGFFVVLYGVALAPLYWVIESQLLLFPFVIASAMHYLAYFLFFCKKCLNTACPQNLS